MLFELAHWRAILFDELDSRLGSVTSCCLSRGEVHYIIQRYASFKCHCFICHLTNCRESSSEKDGLCHTTDGSIRVPAGLGYVAG